MAPVKLVSTREVKSGKTRHVSGRLTQEEAEVWRRLFDRELKKYRRDKKLTRIRSWFFGG